MLFAWQGFELEHPDDWECVRFSKNRQRGECALADRRSIRLVLNWHAAKGNADAGKIFKALSSALSKKDKNGKAGALQDGPGPWGRMEWKSNAKGGDEMIALAQFPERGCVVKAEFAQPDASSRSEALQLLESFRCRGLKGDWHWSAFGCRLHLPADMELEKCEVLPGQASLAFRQRGKSGQSFRIQRLAMPEAHLKGRELKDWIRGATTSERERVSDVRPKAFRGHNAFCANVRPVAESAFQKLMRRKWNGHAAAWICDREQRLYRAEWDGAPVVKEPPLEAWVECQ